MQPSRRGAQTPSTRGLTGAAVPPAATPAVPPRPPHRAIPPAARVRGGGGGEEGVLAKVVTSLLLERGVEAGDHLHAGWDLDLGGWGGEGRE